MILIQKSAENIVVLTLTEKSTLTDPTYLFVFESDQTQSLSIFISADTSEYTDRYNRFTVIETTDPDPLAGEVSLPHSGFYHYTVYEQADTDNLDPELATGIVEIGKVKVLGTDETDYTYEPDAETNYVHTP